MSGRVILAGVLAFAFAGCTPGYNPKPSEERVELYYPSTRQLPPEPVYGRLGYAYAAHPAPLPAEGKAPYLSPVISFQLSQATVKEAVEALAKTLGYGVGYIPEGIASRRVTLVVTGTVDQVVAALQRESGVQADLDHTSRMIAVADTSTTPTLPATHTQ